MRIGIGISEAKKEKRTGIGNYAFLLAKTLREIDHENEYIDLAPDRGLPFYSTHISFANKIRKANVDVFHGAAGSLPLGLRPLSPSTSLGALSPRQGRVTKRMTRCVITVHDLAIYKHPEWFARGQWFSTKIVVPRSIKIADHIIVPSESTKRDLMELFSVAESKITVIPMGVEERFFESDSNSRIHPNVTNSDRYILFVGTVEPRKNLTRLIAAFEGLPEDILREYKLVVAGSRGWGRGEMGERGDGENFRFLDYVPDKDLPALYQNASVFVYPSLYEGFGLPVLEAMAAGVPVVTSRQVAVNIAGFPGIAIDPTSPEDIRKGIEKLIRDNAYASQISREGKELARQFSWERTALETLRVYKTLQ